MTEIKRCLLNAEMLGQLDMLSGKGKGKASFTWERLAQQSSSFCLREFDYQKKLLKKVWSVVMVTSLVIKNVLFNIVIILVPFTSRILLVYSRVFLRLETEVRVVAYT